MREPRIERRVRPEERRPSVGVGEIFRPGKRLDQVIFNSASQGPVEITIRKGNRKRKLVEIISLTHGSARVHQLLAELLFNDRGQIVNANVLSQRMQRHLREHKPKESWLTEREIIDLFKEALYRKEEFKKMRRK